MTVPMVAWMRHRGHGWPASLEMSASMFIPTFAVVGLLWSGLVEGIGTLLMIEHVAMLPSMLVAMLLRREEYSGGAHGHTAIPQEVAA
jgi:flagellar biosynthetic protein FliP